MKILYKHKQIGYLLIYTLGSGVLFSFGTIFFQNDFWIPLLISFLLLICTFLFSSLSVEIKDSYLNWCFAFGFWRKKIPLEDIQSCKVVKNQWIYGWGIRLTPYGWLYNVSGFFAVQINLKNGRKIRIGTDEAEKLCHAINKEIKI